MAEHDYEAGLRDGKIEAIEKMQAAQNDILKDHDKRITAQERIMYGVLGVIVFIEAWPTIQGLV